MGKQQRVSFLQNGNLEIDIKEMVQGITDRNELYEFCQVLPDELKKLWSTILEFLENMVQQII